MALRSKMLTLALLVSCLSLVLSSPFLESSVDSELEAKVNSINEIGEERQLEDAEDRQCNNCGTNVLPTPVVGLDLGLLGDGGLLALMAPILVMQIITLGVLAYLLKGHGGYDDTSYYVSHDSGYGNDGYRRTYEESYRSLIPSEGTVQWIMDSISSAAQLYNQYQNYGETK